MGETDKNQGLRELAYAFLEWEQSRSERLLVHLCADVCGSCKSAEKGDVACKNPWHRWERAKRLVPEKSAAELMGISPTPASGDSDTGDTE